MHASFHNLLQRFFTVWLLDYRCVSQCTIASYSDAFRLLIRWLVESEGIDPDRIDFLEHASFGTHVLFRLPSKRAEKSATTINCRINSFRSSAEFILYEEPFLADWVQNVKTLKKEKGSVLDYLSFEEIGYIIEGCDTASSPGRRDELIIKMLFNSGVRISEFVTLTVSILGIPPKIVLRNLIQKRAQDKEDTPLERYIEGFRRIHQRKRVDRRCLAFPGKNVGHITRSGVRSLIDRIQKQTLRLPQRTALLST